MHRATFWDIKLNKQILFHVLQDGNSLSKIFTVPYFYISFLIKKMDFCSVDRSAVNSDERTIYIIVIPKSVYSKLFMSKVMCLD